MFSDQQINRNRENWVNDYEESIDCDQLSDGKGNNASKLLTKELLGINESQFIDYKYSIEPKSNDVSRIMQE